MKRIEYLRSALSVTGYEFTLIDPKNELGKRKENGNRMRKSQPVLWRRAGSEMGLAEREAKRTGRGVVASIIHAEPIPAAAGKGRPKSTQETKQRISLAILPSLYADVRKVAYVERRSISELIAQLLEQYIQENQKKLEDYGKMKRDP